MKLINVIKDYAKFLIEVPPTPQVWQVGGGAKPPPLPHGRFEMGVP